MVENMKTQKKDANRDAIVKAAETLFQKWGISKTTLEDIAKATGKGKSSIYYYFTSKDDIIEAVATAHAERITRIIRAEVDKKEKAKEKLFTYIYTVFFEARRSFAFFEITRGELLANRGVIFKVINRYYDSEEKIIEEILRYGHERGEFKSIGSHDIKNTVKAFLTIVRSLIISLYIENDDKTLIDHIIVLLSEGF
jgi:hypothetical protein